MPDGWIEGKTAQKQVLEIHLQAQVREQSTQIFLMYAACIGKSVSSELTQLKTRGILGECLGRDGCTESETISLADCEGINNSTRAHNRT